MKTWLLAGALCALVACADSGDDETGLEPGGYSLSWECVDGCNLWLAATLWDQVDLGEEEAWFSEVATVSRRVSPLEWTEDCAELPNGIPNGAEPTDPTMLCLTSDGETEATVTYTGPPGGATRTWRLIATPVPSP
jgi:hypothetical protein